MNPDFRVPETVKVDNGLHEGKEEEIDDVTEENRRIEEQRDAGGQRGEGRAGNSDVPTKKTGPVKKDNREETRTHRHVPGGAWLNKSPPAGTPIMWTTEKPRPTYVAFYMIYTPRLLGKSAHLKYIKNTPSVEFHLLLWVMDGPCRRPQPTGIRGIKREQRHCEKLKRLPHGLVM
ncbi:hypothetical protein NDU88_001376 [Pleurodeles waltl]|uniref:Uncharacterized protein n=1 Tax=Pleurodeles waltl TaxID=8319 RepID=A0AAV7MLJ5_PLEWA|nr:hypothetical protein NDU88_001376 [Pleurodeles waltl]